MSGRESGRVLWVDQQEVILFNWLLIWLLFCSLPHPLPQLYLEANQAGPLKVQYGCCTGAWPFCLQPHAGSRQQHWINHQVLSDLSASQTLVIWNNLQCTLVVFMGEKLTNLALVLLEGEMQAEDAVDRAEGYFRCVVPELARPWGAALVTCMIKGD